MPRMPRLNLHRSGGYAPPLFALLVLASVAITAAYADHAPLSARAHLLGPGASNHPVKIVPSAAVQVPADWPLDSSGALTCLTCHTKIPSEGGAADPHLRRVQSSAASNGGFCATCHHPSIERSDRSVHQVALGIAHLGSNRSRKTVASAGLDAHSRRCLSCHDGASAADSANMTSAGPGRVHVDGTQQNHPVGVAYQRVNRSKNVSRLHPVARLPQQIALPEGKVSCVSCHDLYAGVRYLLAVPTRDSRLCLACHDV